MLSRWLPVAIPQVPTPQFCNKAMFEQNPCVLCWKLVFLTKVVTLAALIFLRHVKPPDVCASYTCCSSMLPLGATLTRCSSTSANCCLHDVDGAALRLRGDRANKFVCALRHKHERHERGMSRRLQQQQCSHQAAVAAVASHLLATFLSRACLSPRSCTPHLTGSKGSAEQKVQPVGGQLLVGFPCPACKVLQQMPCPRHLRAPFLAAVLPTDRREGSLQGVDMLTYP